MTEDTGIAPKPKVEEEKDKEESKSKWNRTYYEKNKQAILERRKQKYMEDPEYRARLLRQSAEQQKRARQERNARLKEQGLKAETPKLYKVVLPDGREIETEMFTSSQLSMFLERKSQTIRLWEHLKLLPPSMYRSLQNRRLYTSFQVQEILRFYKQVIHRHGKQRAMNKLTTTLFFPKIKQLWINYPYGVPDFQGPGFMEYPEE